MTDGIIQEVFKKYYSMGFEVDIDDNTVNVIPANTLEDSFRELIAEIKQVCANTEEIGCFCSRLIGDNQ